MIGLPSPSVIASSALPARIRRIQGKKWSSLSFVLGLL